MKAVAWGTLAVALSLALYLLEQGSFDQDARNLSGNSQISSHRVAESASALHGTDMRDLNDISKVLSKQAGH